MATAKGGPVVPAPPLVGVVVKVPYQVVNDGIVYGPNELAQVPEDVAALWITRGWVTSE